MRIRDEDERSTSDALDVDDRIEPAAMLRDELQERRDERNVAGPPGTGAPRFDAAHELGVEEEARVEEEASAVDAAERDAARSSFLERGHEPLSRADGVPGKAEPARKDARPATGDAADRRRVRAEPVRHLVEAAVAGEDEDRVDVACHGERELGRVSATLGQVGRDAPESRQHSLDERDPMLVDRARKWIDD